MAVPLFVSQAACYSTRVIQATAVARRDEFSMNQIMIVGAGSVGGYFGTHLAKHHPNVSFLLRPNTLTAVRMAS